MSVNLEQDGLYLLPEALEGSTYLILQANQTPAGWQLTECHAVPFGSDQFKTRTRLPDEQLIHFDVDASGALIERSGSDKLTPKDFTMAHLSLIGYLRNGEFIPAKEGL